MRRAPRSLALFFAAFTGFTLRWRKSAYVKNMIRRELIIRILPIHVGCLICQMTHVALEDGLLVQSTANVVYVVYKLAQSRSPKLIPIIISYIYLTASTGLALFTVNNVVARSREGTSKHCEFFCLLRQSFHTKVTRSLIAFLRLMWKTWT